MAALVMLEVAGLGVAAGIHRQLRTVVATDLSRMTVLPHKPMREMAGHRSLWTSLLWLTSSAPRALMMEPRALTMEPRTPAPRHVRSRNQQRRLAAETVHEVGGG